MIRGIGIKYSRIGSVSGIDIVRHLNTQNAATAIYLRDEKGCSAIFQQNGIRQTDLRRHRLTNLTRPADAGKDSQQ